MTELLHGGKPMTFEPINTTVEQLITGLLCGEPQAVVLEPGDMTRYTLLLVPLTGDGVAPHLSGIGVPESEVSTYLFVSKLGADPCRGAFVPMYPGYTVSAHSTAPLSDNTWTQELLAWWFTRLYALLP